MIRALFDRCLTGLRVQFHVWGVLPSLFVWALIIGLWSLVAVQEGLWVLLIGAALAIAWLLAWARIEGVSREDHGPTTALDEDWADEGVSVRARRDLPEDPLYAHRTLGPLHGGNEL